MRERDLLKVAAGGMLIFGTAIGIASRERGGINCTSKTDWHETYATCENKKEFFVVERFGKEWEFEGRMTAVQEKNGFILVGYNNDEYCGVDLIKDSQITKLDHDIKYPWRIMNIRENFIDYYSVDGDFLWNKTYDMEKGNIDIKNAYNFGSYYYMHMYPTCYK